MTTDSETSKPWEDLLDLTRNGTVEALTEFLDTQSASNAALAMSRLSVDERSAVITRIPAEDAASLIHVLPEVQAVELLEQIEPGEAAEILHSLSSSEQADLIGEIRKAEAEAILSKMDPQDAADARQLCQYDEDVAGGLMVTEYLSYRQGMTAAEVIQDMRERSAEYRDYDIQYAYVLDKQGRLTGVLRLRDLLLAAANQQLTELMISSPRSVQVDADLLVLVDFFDAHNYLGVPVVDAEGVLVGVVQRAAVDEASGKRQESDFLKVQGIIGGEEIRALPLLLRARRRLSWLSVNIVLNVIAASVIAVFQDTLSAVIALAVFLPIISDMSGCSGNQAVAVSLRELSLGLVRTEELLRVWLKEISLGLINGLVLGSLIAGVAYAWQGNAWLGFVVGTALCVNTMVAVSLGGIVPLVLRRFNVDPAVAAGPILTTVTDMCGFLLVLGLATLVLNQLVVVT